MREASHDLIQKSLSISSWLNTEKAGLTSVDAKTKPSDFPIPGQYFCGRKLVQHAIQDR
jgi:hypothetical protein